MERALILLFAALMVYVAPGVQGTFHLSFANNTPVNISRDGCGQTKLCVETPEDCDPTGNSSCLFGSVAATTPMAPSGSNLSFELRGDSAGYIALGLTVNASEMVTSHCHCTGRDCYPVRPKTPGLFWKLKIFIYHHIHRVGNTTLFICAQNSSANGMFFFRTAQRDNTNGNFTADETRTREIRGSVEGNVIRCEFNVPNVNATMTRDSHVTTFTVLLGNGSVVGGNLGSFDTILNSGSLNLANPASNVPTTAMPSNVTTAASSNTTSASSGVVCPHVVLLLSVLPLSVMLRA